MVVALLRSSLLFGHTAQTELRRVKESLIHVAFITTERCQSGRMGHTANVLAGYFRPEGSNPSLSASLRPPSADLRLASHPPTPMWHVYILRSNKYKLLYIGSTNNLQRRLNEHNQGKCLSTAPYIPYELACSIAFPSESKARELEKYFKTGSGRTILKKRILNDEDIAEHEVRSRRYCVLSESAKRMRSVLYRAECHGCKSEDTLCRASLFPIW